MVRVVCRLTPVLLPVLLIALGASAALAQDAWPYYELNPTETGDQHTLVRGTGWYLSVAKILIAWLLFACWVKTTDWVSRDALETRQNYVVANSCVFAIFFIAFVLLWLIPSYPVGLTILILAYVGPLAGYIFFRNQSLPEHERVLTPDHLRHFFATRAKKVGIKISTEKKAGHAKGPPVEFIAQGGASDIENKANLLTARQSPAFVAAKELIADAVGHRGDAVMLDFTPDTVAVRYQVDGIWHASEPRDRETGDAMLAVFKKIAALDPAERSRRQSGRFGVEYEGAKYRCGVLAQGVETGERVVLKLEDNVSPLQTLESLGMREAIREKYLELVGGTSGFVLLSSLPAAGLSTMLKVTLQETDRLMRGFVAVEERSRRELEIENVDGKTYDAASGETPATVLPKIIREYPDVLVVPDLSDAPTVETLCAQIEHDRMVIGSIRSKDAAESLLRVLMLKVPAEPFAAAVTAVLNQRLIRRLCTDCRVAYEPTPEILGKLGIPAGRIEALYREPTAEEAQKPCRTCNGLGYLGRVGLFELLIVDDKLREVLTKQPKLDLARKAARAAGMRTMQEEGILLVAKGVTSLQELMRVLKQ